MKKLKLTALIGLPLLALCITAAAVASRQDCPGTKFCNPNNLENYDATFQPLYNQGIDPYYVVTNRYVLVVKPVDIIYSTARPAKMNWRLM